MGYKTYPVAIQYTTLSISPDIASLKPMYVSIIEKTTPPVNKTDKYGEINTPITRNIVAIITGMIDKPEMVINALISDFSLNIFDTIKSDTGKSKNDTK